MLTAFCGFVGLVLGAAYASRFHEEALKKAAQEGHTADFLPVGVLFMAVVGAVIGCIVAGSLVFALKICWATLKSRGERKGS